MKTHVLAATTLLFSCIAITHADTYPMPTPTGSQTTSQPQATPVPPLDLPKVFTGTEAGPIRYINVVTDPDIKGVRKDVIYNVIDKTDVNTSTHIEWKIKVFDTNNKVVDTREGKYVQGGQLIDVGALELSNSAKIEVTATLYYDQLLPSIISQSIARSFTEAKSIKEIGGTGNKLQIQIPASSIGQILVNPEKTYLMRIVPPEKVGFMWSRFSN